ncbi:MAG: hypothetical protein ABSF29_01290 [Tepidisphaeraceae bacterium]|jgi:hypothetical protein
MRRLFLIFLSLSVFPAAIAAADDQQAVIAAATASAVDRLHDDIDAESIRPDLTVKLFLDRTDSDSQLTTVLNQAQQVGGPRWIDSQTCQVRMDIPAPVVRDQLRLIAIDHSQTSPISAGDLARNLKSWDARVFSATGTSTGSIDLIRPPPGSEFWQTVSESEIRQSVAGARQNAADRLLASIAPVSLAGGKTIGDALAIPSVHQAMTDWIASQPITMADFQDDHQVQITLAVSADGMSEKLRNVLSARSDLSLPADDKAWAQVAAAISKNMSPPQGYGGAIAAVATQPQLISLPDPPPDWIFQQLDASASATADSPLLAARAAELAATSNLRQQIQKLPLPQGKTVQDLAAENPRFAQAIDRTLARSAHVYSVEYHPDGSASVRISLNLQDLWQMLWLAR